MIELICSGGQIGADEAALEAAFEYGIKTSGYMPLGFKTKDGNRPDLAQKYNLIENCSPYYPPRTALNVKTTDATVRFAIDFDTAGEILTASCAHQYNKPLFDVHVLGTTTPEELAVWIIKNNINKLNVAGNGRHDIKQFVKLFMLNTFEITNPR